MTPVTTSTAANQLYASKKLHKAIIEGTSGKKLQVDFGNDMTALNKHVAGGRWRLTAQFDEASFAAGQRAQAPHWDCYITKLVTRRNESTRKRCPRCKMIGRLAELEEEVQQGALMERLMDAGASVSTPDAR